MARALIVSHPRLDTMVLLKVKFNRGDGIEPKGGLVSGGSEGPEPLTCVLERLKIVESP